MAALKEKWGPNRSPESTQDEVKSMKKGPKNMAKINSAPKYGQKSASEGTKYEISSPKKLPQYVQKNVQNGPKYEINTPKYVNEKGNSPKSDIQTESVIKLKSNLRPLVLTQVLGVEENLIRQILPLHKSQIAIYLNKSGARRIYTRKRNLLLLAKLSVLYYANENYPNVKVAYFQKKKGKK